MPGCTSAGMAERSYPSLRPGVAAERGYPLSEVRSRPGGAILHLKSGVLAGRSHPVPEARGGGQ